MRRTPLYSASTPPAPLAGAAMGARAGLAAPPRRWRRRLGTMAWVAGFAAALTALWLLWTVPAVPTPTQGDIDRAVREALARRPLPAPAADAFAAVRGAVVKVVGLDEIATTPAAPGNEGERGVGTGVVIVDNGTILTNLHVVLGARRVKVVFADGLESDADVMALRPEHDLAVLRAHTIPDDLQAATLRATTDLRPGDRVSAIGFPFGIGPSVSHGVVSGLKREFRSPEGQRILTNLIQFDAAANPGNSGGPLVTDGGEVVGIVTAIFNPTEERFFVGVGFAVPIESAAQAAGMPPF